MNELADLVKKITASNSEIVHVPYDRAYEQGFEDMPRRVPDVSKIRQLIGYHPSVDLEGILAKIITTMRESLRVDLGCAAQAAE
jgi:UDP-glucose 4-epimerase